MLLWIIVLCEAGFWVLLVTGLLARYALGLRRTNSVLLICVPVTDIVLLIATTIDLTVNATAATFAHGLAVLYIGFTIAFGAKTIRWADAWFAYRFASGPRPTPPPAGGWDYVWNDWKLYGRALIGYGIAWALIVAAIYFIDDPARTAHLAKWLPVLFTSASVWFLFGPIYTTLFKRRVPVE